MCVFAYAEIKNKYINPYMSDAHYPLLQFEEILEKLHDGSNFSTIYPKDAYLQLPIYDM